MKQVTITKKGIFPLPSLESKLQKICYTISNEYLGHPINKELRIKMLNSFKYELSNQFILERIICDETNNTVYDIDNNICKVDIRIRINHILLKDYRLELVIQ